MLASGENMARRRKIQTKKEVLTIAPQKPIPEISSRSELSDFFSYINDFTDLPDKYEINIRTTPVFDGIKCVKNDAEYIADGENIFESFLFGRIKTACPENNSGPGVIVLRKSFYLQQTTGLSHIDILNEIISGKLSIVSEQAVEEKAAVFIQDHTVGQIGYQPSRIMSGLNCVLESVAGHRDYFTVGMMLQVASASLCEKIGDCSKSKIIFKHPEKKEYVKRTRRRKR